MKKTYIQPEIEITAFTTEDIITASTVSSGMKKTDDVIGNGLRIDLKDKEWT